MKQKHLGTFELGYENVDLFAVKNLPGGEFYFTPDGSSPARIKVGMNYATWAQVYNVLLHEAMEFCLKRLRLAQVTQDNLSSECSDVFFHLNHNDLTEICRRTALFALKAAPLLEKQYRKWRK